MLAILEAVESPTFCKTALGRNLIHIPISRKMLIYTYYIIYYITL